MKGKTGIFIWLIFLLFCFVIPASANYTVVKNMDEYCDGVYEYNFVLVGNGTPARDYQSAQHFRVLNNVSVDRLGWYNPVAAQANVTDYTIVLYQAYDNVTDGNLREDHILYAGVSTELGIGAHYIDFPRSIELKNDRLYGVQFLIDRDGIYTNHEGLGSGLAGQFYLQGDNSGGASMPRLTKNSNVASWSASTSVINITLYANDSIPHATNIPDYDPTFSTNTSWVYAPTIDKVSNTQLVLNSHSFGWQNDTTSPSWIIDVDDLTEYGTEYGNNTVTLTIENSGIYTESIYYINRTITSPIVEQFPYSGTLSIDSNGDIWIFTLGKTFMSPDGGITFNTISTNNGFSGFTTSRMFQYNDTVWFGTSPYNGVWRSINNDTFTNVLSGSFMSWSIVFDGTDIYASTYQQDAQNSSVYVSHDVGDTWELLFDPQTRHVHGMGMVDQDLVVCLGDRNQSTVNESVGVWRLASGLSPIKVVNQTQMTCVIDAGDVAVYGGDDSRQGIFLISNSNWDFSSSVLNESYRNAVYTLSQDDATGYLYGGMTYDFGYTQQAGVAVSITDGQQWRYLSNVSGMLTDVSKDGFLYTTSVSRAITKVHVPSGNAIASLPQMTDVYSDGAILNKANDIFIIDTLYKNKANLYFNKFGDVSLVSNGAQFSLYAIEGDIVLFTDTMTDADTQRIYSNGTTVSHIPVKSVTNSINTFSIEYDGAGYANISNVTMTDRVIRWTLSSDDIDATVTHTIGGFPANIDIDIYRDGTFYDTAIANETGYITWVYDGGFSEHEFSILLGSDFTVSTTTGSAPHSVKFSNTSNATSYAWDFENDGIIDSTKQNPVHTYGKAGTYTVNLTVQNEYGNFSTVKTDYITVSAPAFASDPVAWFNWVFSYLSSMYVSIWVTA